MSYLDLCPRPLESEGESFPALPLTTRATKVMTTP